MKYCRTSAAAPATVGVAMDVPLMAMVPSLLLFFKPSESADTIPVPGAVTVGLILPSAVYPLLLKKARFSAEVPFPEAPTLITLLAVAGVLTVFTPGPELPFANSVRKSLCSQMNRSAVAESIPYVFPSPPQLLVWILVPASYAVKKRRPRSDGTYTFVPAPGTRSWI